MPSVPSVCVLCKQCAARIQEFCGWNLWLGSSAWILAVRLCLLSWASMQTGKNVLWGALYCRSVGMNADLCGDTSSFPNLDITGLEECGRLQLVCCISRLIIQKHNCVRNVQLPPWFKQPSYVWSSLFVRPFPDKINMFFHFCWVLDMRDGCEFRTSFATFLECCQTSSHCCNITCSDLLIPSFISFQAVAFQIVIQFSSHLLVYCLESRVLEPCWQNHCC